MGRGSKSSQQPKDVFFMVLAVVKHGGLLDFVARMFELKRSTFERLIIRFVKLFSMIVFHKMVDYGATQ